jgi:general secretion pathway protein G
MKSSTRGFTLIELTIVLALVALLLTIAVPRYFHALDSGKAAVQRQNLATMRDAIDKYFGDLGKYPDDLDDLVRKKYLRSIPVDPLTDKPNWTVVAPDDPTLGRVYDVLSATPPHTADADAAASTDAQVRPPARENASPAAKGRAGSDAQ